MITNTSTASTRLARLGFLTACVAALAACGSGGSDASTNNPTPSPAPTPAPAAPAPAPAPASTVPVGTTQTTPTYTEGSAQAQIFASINAYRAQCGFPAYQQNTILDQAATNHADYMIANGNVITDDEVQGNPGFTGATGQDRANALGWPTDVFAGASDAGAIYTNATLTQAEYGRSMVDAWSAGVYHQATIGFPASLIGVGVAQTTLNGFPEVLGGVELAESSTTIANVTTANNPLTFPCQGVTGVPYEEVSEEPTPPNTSGAWGTPITVMGNPTDVIALSSATMLATGDSDPITLNILTKANDTTGLIGQYQAVAYPLAPLLPNTTYSVSLAGTVNGVSFTRSFTFTTGTAAG